MEWTYVEQNEWDEFEQLCSLCKYTSALLSGNNLKYSASCDVCFFNAFSLYNDVLF